MCWPATLRHRRREGHPKNGGNQGFSLMRMLRSRARLIHRRGPLGVDDFARVADALAAFGLAIERAIRLADRRRTAARRGAQDRKSVVQGKSVSVRVDIGGRRIIKIKSSLCHSSLNYS